MRLSREEEKMLEGSYGEAVQQAMEFQVQVGDYYQADEMVEINQISQDLSLNMHHNYGLELVETYAGTGAKFRSYTKVGHLSMDADRWEELGSPEEVVLKQSRLAKAYIELGAIPYFTSLPVLMPHFGEHVAWTGSNTCLLVNSFYGARTNLESPLSALMASLTGRTPKFGLHLTENRYGNILIEVQAEIQNPTNWDALGYAIGRQVREYNQIPVFASLPEIRTMGDRQRFDSSLVSYGTIGMYHIVGKTPEARSLKDAFGDREPRTKLKITKQDIDSTYEQFSKSEGEVDAVSFGGHHLTIDQFPGIMEKLQGKRVHENVRLWIFTSIQYKTILERLKYDRIIANAGGQLIYDTSLLFMTPKFFSENLGVKTVVSDSAKMCHYIGGYGMTPVFRSIDDCIKAALTGDLKR